AAAARFMDAPTVLVGDRDTIARAAELRGVDPARFRPFAPERPLSKRAIYVLHAEPTLSARDRRPGAPSRTAGAAQLAYIDRAYDLVRSSPRFALVTGPVSKAVIAGSGVRGAAEFLGHTEWLQARDRAASSVMCFASNELATSLVTTHLPLGKVARSLTPASVASAIVGLVALLDAVRTRPFSVAVCSLNPHAGEGELLGKEEARAIVPGMQAAGRRIGRGVRLVGPIGAETAYRKALARQHDGVVAMYHDQATIPMKLVAFGEAVNVTMGLSVVRTSVDHGTGYDIAWQGVADEAGMLSAMHLGARLVG
ncbi:MAG TPA: 4-hydroxythreonine-4-phosphate dehydrogenase PdxA, partial [Polyangiaceae bacterium]